MPRLTFLRVTLWAASGLFLVSAALSVVSAFAYTLGADWGLNPLLAYLCALVCILAFGTCAQHAADLAPRA